MSGKPGRSGRLPRPTVILQVEGKKKRYDRRDEPRAHGTPSMDPPPYFNERQTELYRLAILTAPRGLFGACDAGVIAAWALAAYNVEIGGPLPMWVKLRRRLAAELGFTPLTGLTQMVVDARSVAFKKEQR